MQKYILVNRSFQLALLISSALSIASCGGGSSETIKELEGTFKDSNVSGLSYTSGNIHGITDQKGKFKYEEGKDIAFSIGEVKLGSSHGKSIITPLDLTENGKLASTEVINIARFLMMLDADNNPSNGISISNKVTKKAKEWLPINFDSSSFPSQAVIGYLVESSVEDNAVHKLPTADEATKHLRTTLLCANTGSFIGSYSGVENGSISLMLDPVTGAVKGSSYNPDNKVSVEVKNTTPIDYDTGLSFISAENSAKIFAGKFTSTDKIEGNWRDISRPTRKGEFVTTRIEETANIKYRYTASFLGNDKGVLSFGIDHKNKITGSLFSVSTQKENKLEGSLNGTKFSAKTTNGTVINGIVKNETQELSGVWSNVDSLQTGTFSGGGCIVN